MTKPVTEYFSKTLLLSNAVAKSSGIDENKVTGLIKSIKILDSTLASAKVYAYFPQTNENILITVGVPHNFSTPRQGCILHWAAQSGAQVTIGFSEKVDFAVGPMTVSSIDTVYQMDGNLDSQTLETVNTTPSDILEARDNRSLAEVENIGSVAVYCGTLANCNSADYQNECEVLYPGDRLTWKSPSAYYFRTATTTSTNGLRLKEFVRG